MKMKTERDFKAEELYELTEIKYAEQFTKWTNDLSKCTLDNEDDFENSACIATKMVYGKCLLDVIHGLDMNIEEINQVLQLMNNENSFSKFVELFISLGAEPSTQSISKYFWLVIHTIMWYEHK